MSLVHRVVTFSGLISEDLDCGGVGGGVGPLALRLRG